jgi:PAS domain-containing protein
MMKALITNEKAFRWLAETVPHIVWIIRADGWNIYFNQQWVDYTGLIIEESMVMIGTTLFILTISSKPEMIGRMR